MGISNAEANHRVVRLLRELFEAQSVPEEILQPWGLTLFNETLGLEPGRGYSNDELRELFESAYTVVASLTRACQMFALALRDPEVSAQGAEAVEVVLRGLLLDADNG
ncbi:MAG: hypothetical protein AB7W59_31750 [Acidimicrobiia bacterium]